MAATGPIIESERGASPQVTAPSSTTNRTGRPIRVFMMDLLSIVPYYTGHLCAALKRDESFRVQVGSISYHLDPDFFRRNGLETDPGLVNIVSSVPGLPAAGRRVAKVGESIVNMVALLIRFLFSRPDIVHVQFLPMVKYGLPFDLWFLRTVKRMGVRVVYTVHNLLPQDTGKRFYSAYRSIYSLTDALICHNEATRLELITKFGVSDRRITVIPHGPLFDSRGQADSNPARQRLGIAPGETLVLWQGILRPYKGVPFLLDAWKQVTDEYPAAKLAIVGTGDNEQNRTLSEQVTRLGLSESVRLELRFVTVDELADYYAASDIVVYPYAEITTSGALMTGLSYGRAIIATKLPAFEQVLRLPDSALFVEYGDTGGLSSAVCRLIDDPALRHRLGGQARACYEAYPQWDAIARMTSATYRRVIENA